MGKEKQIKVHRSCLMEFDKGYFSCVFYDTTSTVQKSSQYITCMCVVLYTKTWVGIFRLNDIVLIHHMDL